MRPGAGSPAFTPGTSAWERLFDPPCLGAPDGFTACARVQAQTGAFVSLYLCAKGPLLCDAGFLCDGSPELVLVASAWCEMARGKTLDQAAALGQPALLARAGLGAGHGQFAALCLSAARLALARARTQDKAGNETHAAGSGQLGRRDRLRAAGK